MTAQERRPESHAADLRRLTGFSDGVMAVPMTIMVLEIKIPSSPDISALVPLLPIFFVYALSFLQIGLYVNNHHYLLRAAKYGSSAIMWSNLVFLFFLSLLPFVTGWMGEHFTSPWATALFGVDALCAGIAYNWLQRAVMATRDAESVTAAGLATDLKGIISLALYALAIPLAFVNHWVANVIYVAIAVMWIIPDSRIERLLRAERL
ncbi:MAG TPA: TMEM175 family protein [Candidatus Saccharimonas sp.]|nr:TMEM175 family protein [Candidatus Saccharimonas sp.]